MTSYLRSENSINEMLIDLKFARGLFDVCMERGTCFNHRLSGTSATDFKTGIAALAWQHLRGVRRYLIFRLAESGKTNTEITKIVQVSHDTVRNDLIFQVRELSLNARYAEEVDVLRAAEMVKAGRVKFHRDRSELDFAIVALKEFSTDAAGGPLETVLP